MVVGRSTHPVPCERALELASLRLDAELSELEAAALGQHLDACARCAASVARMEAVTRAVRTAPFEQPGRRFELPRRPARPLARLAAIAAVLVLAVGFSVLGAAIGGGSEPPPPSSPQDVAVVPEEDFGDLRELPRQGGDGRVPGPRRPVGVPV